MQTLLELFQVEFSHLCNDFVGEVKSDLATLDVNLGSSDSSEEFTNLLEEVRDINKNYATEYGMNTFGILLDRITILICKNRFSTDEESRNIASEQLKNVVKMLVCCGIGDPALLKKEQVHPEFTNYVSPGHAAVVLLRANIGMWINQDLLYSKNVDEVSSTRLRDYIKFFSRENSMRNTSISYLDNWFNNRMKNER